MTDTLLSFQFTFHMLNVDENHPGAEELLKRGPFSVARSFIPGNRCAFDKTIEETFMKHAKSRGGGMGVGNSGISNNPEAYQRWTRTMHQRSQFLAKILVTAQLEKGDNGNEHCDLRPTEIQRSEKNVESVVEAFENLLNPLDVEDKEGIYCISSGLCVTLDIQEDLLKAEIYGKEMKDKFIRERLATRIIFFDRIKRSMLKTIESANKKVMIKTSDERLIEYKQQGNLAWCKSGTRTSGPGTPLRFKSGTPGPHSKFKSWTPGLPTKFKSGTPSPFFNEFIFFRTFLRFFYLFIFVSFLNNIQKKNNCE